MTEQLDTGRGAFGDASADRNPTTPGTTRRKRADGWVVETR